MRRLRGRRLQFSPPLQREPLFCVGGCAMGCAMKMRKAPPTEPPAMERSLPKQLPFPWPQASLYGC